MKFCFVIKLPQNEERHVRSQTKLCYKDNFDDCSLKSKGAIKSTKTEYFKQKNRETRKITIAIKIIRNAHIERETEVVVVENSLSYEREITETERVSLMLQGLLEISCNLTTQNKV